MRLFVFLILNFVAVIAGGFQSANFDKEILGSTVAMYKNAKTLRDLIRLHPNFGPGAETIHSAFLKNEMDKKLSNIGFDLNRMKITIEKTEIEFVNLNEGVVKIDGRRFQFDREYNYYENLEQLFRLMIDKKSAHLFNFFVNEAYAQNRDEFPITEGPELRGTDVVKGVAALSMFGHSFVSGMKAVVQGVALTKLAKITTVAVLTSVAVNKAHAYLAPSCENQIKNLKRIMNEGKISLRKIQCGVAVGLGYEQAANISFWTPDKKELPFYANWESGEVAVNNYEEIYHFGRNKLSAVEFRGDKSGELTEGPAFKKYQTKLEPYRQVFYEIGIYNSCHKCQTEFNNFLAQNSPGRYVEESARIGADSTSNENNSRNGQEGR